MWRRVQADACAGTIQMRGGINMRARQKISARAATQGGKEDEDITHIYYSFICASCQV